MIEVHIFDEKENVRFLMRESGFKSNLAGRFCDSEENVDIFKPKKNGENNVSGNASDTCGNTHICKKSLKAV